MEMIHYDRDVAETIDGLEGASQVSFGNSAGEAHLSVIHLGAGGGLPAHEAPTGQLFVVIDGEGWVSGQDGERHAISSGKAVFWSQGEMHESGTDSGMAAVIVQALQFNLAATEA